MKYIKFVKNHTSGNFLKGDHVKVENTVFDAWTDSEFAVASTKKEYDEHVKDKENELIANSKEARKAHQEKIDKLSGKGEKVHTINPSGDGDDSGNDNSGSDGGNGSQDGAEDPAKKLYHVLTEQDLKSNEIYCKDLKVGTEVEIDENDLFVLGDNDQMIVKPTE